MENRNNSRWPIQFDFVSHAGPMPFGGIVSHNQYWNEPEMKDSEKVWLFLSRCNGVLKVGTLSSMKRVARVLLHRKVGLDKIIVTDSTQTLSR